MSQASELLNSLPTPTATTADEAHIVVGEDRFITVPNSLKRIAVQHDHNVETVTFDCPRFWDGLDMSQMVVYINYMLPSKEKAAYIAQNVEADGDIMHFTWTISSNVTQKQGQIAFLVCVKKTELDENNEPIEVNHWNSELCTDCYISEGMECDVDIPMEYPDIVTQLLERMEVVEQININAVDMQRILAETQVLKAEVDRVYEQATDASDYIKNSYAPAIKGQASGEIIRVDDVSPIEHDVMCRVHGKNLFNINDYVTEIDYGNGNKTIYAINTDHLVIGRTYTVFSSVPMRWFKISNSATGYSCCGKEGGATGFTSLTFVYKRDLNILETAQLHMYIDNMDKTAMYDLSIMESMNICLVEVLVATEYEPYLDPTTVNVVRCKRNIFNVGTVSDYQSIGDMVIDGHAIKCTVTSANSSHVVNTTNKYPSGTYTLRFDYSDSAPRMLLRLFNKDGSVITSNETLRQDGYQYNDAYRGFFKNGRETVLTISEDVAYWCLGFVFPVTDTAPVGSVENVYGVRLEYGDGANQFEICDDETITPESDGTCTVTSKSPTMTIFTDTPGAIVEAEYNRDTTKMFESYVLTDNAKSQIVAEVEDDMAEVLAALNSYAASLTGGAN